MIETLKKLYARRGHKMSVNTPRIKHLICGLDIGTTKVALVMASATREGVEIIGVGQAPNLGVRHGVVVNIDQTVAAIVKAKEEAELMAGVEATQVWASVGGTHIQSMDSAGMIAIRGADVTNQDVERVIEVAKAVAVPADRQILHVLPKEYRIDEQEGITDPIGMSGVRLECRVHIITANKSMLHSVHRAVEKAGLKLKGVALQQFATATACLSNDEKNLGVAVVDIGGGTSDLIIYQRGAVVHTTTIPVGGNNFTHDVAMGLRTTQVNAEGLKLKFGCALSNMINMDDNIEVDTVGGRPHRTVPRSTLCKIVEARAEETLKIIKAEIDKHGYFAQLGSGVVLSGGASELQGFVEMGEFIFDVPVRIGMPAKVGGLYDIVRGARFATALGLVLHGHLSERSEIKEAGALDAMSETVGTVTNRIKDFFIKSI
jgi:cell division protein FtsA